MPPLSSDSNRPSSTGLTRVAELFRMPIYANITTSILEPTVHLRGYRRSMEEFCNQLPIHGPDIRAELNPCRHPRDPIAVLYIGSKAGRFAAIPDAMNHGKQASGAMTSQEIKG